MIGPTEIVFIAMGALMVAAVHYSWERARRLEASLNDSTTTENTASANWLTFFFMDRRTVPSLIALTTGGVALYGPALGLSDYRIGFLYGVTCAVCGFCLLIDARNKEALR